jgi:hypothetical protein
LLRMLGSARKTFCVTYSHIPSLLGIKNNFFNI